MSDTPKRDVEILKIASRMIAESLNADTVVILVQRGDDKFMQQAGDNTVAAATLVLDGAKQVAIVLANLLRDDNAKQKEVQP